CESVTTQHELIAMLADPDLDHVAAPPHALAPQMVSRDRNGRPDHRIEREAQLPALLADHSGHVGIIAEAGVETAEAMDDLRPEQPAHARYDVQEVDARPGEPAERELQGVFDLLQTREQVDRAVQCADVGGHGTDARIGERQQPVLHGAILDDRICIGYSDELAPRHANADIERARLAVAARG